MILKINDKKLDKYTEVSVSLRYDSVGSTFSFVFYFDPNDADHKAMFKPGQFSNVTIEHNGQRLITGTLLGTSFRDSAEPELIQVSGYSKTGVLEDCEIPLSAYPLQSDNINLKDITEKIIKPFGIKLIVDGSVSSKCGSNYKNSHGGDTQSCKAYITELANQKHVIVTHDELGNLVFTEAKTGAKPIHDFSQGQPGISYKLNFDGQKMHSDIRVQRQAGRSGGNAGKANIDNPYCKVFRPRVARQSSGNDTSTDLAARNMLSEELKGIPLTIEMVGWELDGKLVRPNSIISVTNPRLYLYKKTNFFIEQVEYKEIDNRETAVLTCYLPEVYGGGTPKNIFE